MLVLSASLLVAPFLQNFDPIAPLTKEVEQAARTVTGDFNGDGQADLILFGRSGSKALVHLGDGTGSFDRILVIGTDLGGIAAAAAGDLDGDGILDLALVSRPGAGGLGRTLLGVGDGTFRPPSPLSMPTFGDRAGRLRIVDLEGDGDMDIVMGGDVVVGFQNLGAGIFAPGQTLVGLRGNDVTLLDIDGDGDLDLAQARPISTGLVLSEQVTPFQFSPVSDVSTGAAGDRIEAADFDNDGDLDIVLVHNSTGITIFVENQGAGVFAFAATLNFVTDCSDFEVTDVNGDGRLDIVGTAAAPNSSFWFENVAAFSFNYRVLPNAAEPAIRTLSRADFNGDGVDDFALTRSAGDVDLMISDGSLGAVPYGADSSRVHGVPPRFDDVIATDLDGDGDLDIVGSTVLDGVYGLENIGFSSFAATEQLVAPVLNGFLGTEKLRAIDLDGDTHQDLLCVAPQGLVTWLEGDGTGSLQPRRLNASGTIAVGDAYPGDVDGDGDLDVLVAGANDSILLLRQTSPGVFATSVLALTLPGDLREIRLAHMDNDDILDLALFLGPPQGPSLSPVSLQRSLGVGDGTFLSPVLLFEGLEDADQIELVNAGSATGPDDFIWSSLSAPKIDGAVANFSLPYVNLQGLALLNKRAQRFSIGALFYGDDDDLIIQEGVGTDSNPAALVAYSKDNGGFDRADVVASGLSTVNAFGIHDLNGDDAADVLVANQGAPRLTWIRNRRKDLATIRYCSPAVPNVTGRPASISAFGGVLNFDQDYILQASDLPSNVTTLFLTSQSQGFRPVVPGSIGALCLGSSIGRFVGPGQVQTSNADGVARLLALRTMMPTPGGFVNALNGSVWFFQAWYRDSQGGAPVSNFTDGLAVRFD